MKLIRQPARLLRWPLLALLALALLTGLRATPDALERVTERQQLVLGTLRSPVTWFQAPDGDAGMDHDLVKGFAQELGVSLEIREAATLEELFQMLEQGEVDLAAAGLALTPQRQRRFSATTPYGSVEQLIIHRRQDPRPRQLHDLSGRRILVEAESAQAELLARLQSEVPFLGVVEIRGHNTEVLLSTVQAGEADYTLVDSNEFAIYRHLYPDLSSAFAADSVAQTWYLKPETQPRLWQAAQRFLTRQKASGQVARLHERYFRPQDRFDLYATRVFQRHLDERLPRYEEHFRKAADLTGFDWRLLAALSYQESMWDPRAQSPTGVRGLMMLTLATAREMGVDREDPRQSILAGAAYLQKLHNRIPEHIAEPDRTWMALAAYNMGWGHLEDARILTRRQGGNADLWNDVRERVLLLSRSEHHRQTRLGYAPGGQAVVYVRSVRRLYDQMVLADNHARQAPLQLVQTDLERLHTGTL